MIRKKILPWILLNLFFFGFVLAHFLLIPPAREKKRATQTSFKQNRFDVTKKIYFPKKNSSLTIHCKSSTIEMKKKNHRFDLVENMDQIDCLLIDHSLEEKRLHHFSSPKGSYLYLNNQLDLDDLSIQFYKRDIESLPYLEGNCQKATLFILPTLKIMTENMVANFFPKRAKQ